MSVNKEQVHVVRASTRYYENGGGWEDDSTYGMSHKHPSFLSRKRIVHGYLFICNSVCRVMNIICKIAAAQNII